MEKNRISIASDHAGFALKHELVSYLNDAGYQVKDLGPSDDSRVDYPDFAKLVAKDIGDQACDYGVLVCGSGIGMAITANKTKGVRAASIVDLYSVEMARKHNNLNLLCLGSRILDKDKAIEILDKHSVRRRSTRGTGEED